MTGEKRGAGGRGGGGRGGGKKGKWFGGAGGGAGSLPHGTSGVLVTCDSGRGRVTCHQLVEVFEEARGGSRGRLASGSSSSAAHSRPLSPHSSLNPTFPPRPRAERQRRARGRQQRRPAWMRCSRRSWCAPRFTLLGRVSLEIRQS